MLSEKSRQTLISLWGISKECGQVEIADALEEALAEIDTHDEIEEEEGRCLR